MCMCATSLPLAWGIRRPSLVYTERLTDRLSPRRREELKKVEESKRRR